MTVLLHLVYAFALYNYISTESNPLPRRAFNWTAGRYSAFVISMSFISYLTAVWDGLLSFVAVSWLNGVLRPTKRQMGYSLVTTMVATVILVFCTVVFQPWIIAGILEARSYNHYCQAERDWLQVTLEGHRYDHTTGPNTATFSLVQTGETLFRFTSSNPDANTFALDRLETGTPTVVPSLRSVLFNETTGFISGSCFGTPDDDACSLRGFVWLDNGLSFDVALNNSGTRSETTLWSAYPDWLFRNVPQTILFRGDTGASLLQTSMPMPGRCERMKLCVTHAAKADAVPPDVIAVAGWMLRQLSEQSVKCTASTV